MKRARQSSAVQGGVEPDNVNFWRRHSIPDLIAEIRGRASVALYHALDFIGTLREYVFLAVGGSGGNQIVHAHTSASTVPDAVGQIASGVEGAIRGALQSLPVAEPVAKLRTECAETLGNFVDDAKEGIEGVKTVGHEVVDAAQSFIGDAGELFLGLFHRIKGNICSDTFSLDGSPGNIAGGASPTDPVKQDSKAVGSDEGTQASPPRK